MTRARTRLRRSLISRCAATCPHPRARSRRVRSRHHVGTLSMVVHRALPCARRVWAPGPPQARSTAALHCSFVRSSHSWIRVHRLPVWPSAASRRRQASERRGEFDGPGNLGVCRCSPRSNVRPAHSLPRADAGAFGRAAFRLRLTICAKPDGCIHGICSSLRRRPAAR